MEELNKKKLKRQKEKINKRNRMLEGDTEKKTIINKKKRDR